MSVTFRGYTPRDQLVLEVRNAASRLECADEVHAVIRCDGSDQVEVLVQAKRDDEQVHCKARHRDVRVALAEAFERISVAQLALDVATTAA